MQKSVFLNFGTMIGRQRLSPLAPLAALFISVLATSGCSSLSKPSPEPVIQEEVSQPIKAKLPEGDFTPETLYALLSAEIAGQRGRFDISLLNYVQQARKTKDIGIIQRAVHVAEFLKADNALTELGHTWLEVEPEAIEPNQILAFQSIQRNEYDNAIEYMERIHLLGGNPDFEALAVHAKSLPAADQEKLLGLYQGLAQKYPSNKDIGYGYALVSRTRGKQTESLQIIESYLKQDPEFQPGLLLKATLLYDLGRIKEALALLGDSTRDFPDNRKLATLYARMLIDDGNLERSEEEYRKLVKRFPDTPSLKLAHALVSLELGDKVTMAKEMQELLESGQHLNEAHFYLGRTADEEGRQEEAIQHYQEITSGTHYFNALARASFLRANSGDLDGVLANLNRLREANPEQEEGYWQVEVNVLLDLEDAVKALEKTNEALIHHPNNTALLYARAMLLDRSDRISELEMDLRRILELEPDNAVALNALGYTLADKTDRYLEAFELISRAEKLNPDSPAVIDSLGWVYYRMGDTKQALTYLKTAYARFPDPEVAAHYGEVLWMTGEKEFALSIWRKAFEKDKNHRILLNTLKRFDVSFQ